MSLLSTLEQTIKSYKVLQEEINGNIRLFQEMLQSLESPPQPCFDMSEVNDETGNAAAASSSGEKDDIHLLEQALEKALRVRTGLEASKKHKVKHKCPEPVKGQETGADSPAGGQKIPKSSSKSASVVRKGNHKVRSLTSSTPGSRPAASFKSGHSKTTNNRNIIQNHPASSAGVVHHQAASASGSANDISTWLSKNKDTRNNMLGDVNLGKSASVSATSHRGKSGEGSVFQQDGVLFGETMRWKSLKRRQNRLWDKAIDLHRKPVVGRSLFMERMRTTFPKDWPRGSPDQTRALLSCLTHRGCGLSQRRPNVDDALVTSETSREQEGGKNQFVWMNEDLKCTVEDFRNLSDHVAQEWKAWNRWSPEGGCLCATEASGSVWVDGKIAPLPFSVTYTTEAELQELERLRMRVALVEQDISLEQALFEALSPLLPPAVLELGFSNPSVLRDLYSLLGEGGERFPAIVLDSEPD